MPSISEDIHPSSEDLIQLVSYGQPEKHKDMHIMVSGLHIYTTHSENPNILQIRKRNGSGGTQDPQLLLQGQSEVQTQKVHFLQPENKEIGAYFTIDQFQ